MLKTLAAVVLATSMITGTAFAAKPSGNVGATLLLRAQAAMPKRSWRKHRLARSQAHGRAYAQTRGEGSAPLQGCEHAQDPRREDHKGCQNSKEWTHPLSELGPSLD